MLGLWIPCESKALSDRKDNPRPMKCKVQKQDHQQPKAEPSMDFSPDVPRQSPQGMGFVCAGRKGEIQDVSCGDHAEEKQSRQKIDDLVGCGSFHHNTFLRGVDGFPSFLHFSQNKHVKAILVSLTMGVSYAFFGLRFWAFWGRPQGLEKAFPSVSAKERDV